MRRGPNATRLGSPTPPCVWVGRAVKGVRHAFYVHAQTLNFRGLFSSTSPSSHAFVRHDTAHEQAMPKGGEPKPPSFLHIDDYDEAKVDALLDRAAEVKERLQSGDRSFQPFKGREGGLTHFSSQEFSRHIGT